MENIQIKPYFSTVIHSENTVELRHGVWNSMSHMLNDENEEGILANIILSLDGKENPLEIAKRLEIKRSKIEGVLDYLQQLGVLQIKSESFLDYYANDLAATLKRPGQFVTQIPTPIVLLGDSYINEKLYKLLSNLINVDMIEDKSLWSVIQRAGDDWLYDALAQQRFLEQFAVWQGKFLVLTSKHINPVMATRLNRITHELNIPWLHLALDGPFIFIGPTFHGQQAPCYDCFETRISMNLRESENYQRYKKALVTNSVHSQAGDPLLAVTANLLTAHGVLEILNYLTTNCSFTTNKILSIFLPTMEFIYHDLLRLPSCRTCGSISYRDDTQLYFDFQRLMDGVAE